MSATPATENRPAAKQFATFTVGDLYFGVEVLEVQEVLRFHEMTPVPSADPVIEGLINLRGQIVTAFDMRRRLGLDDRPDGEEPMNMVVHGADGAVSLLVDDIGDVIELSRDDFEPPPETISEQTREVLEGVYKLPERLMLALSTNKVLRV